MRIVSVLAMLALAACATAQGPHIVSKPKKRTVKAGILGGHDEIPAEREGVRLEDTGAIMWVCSNSPEHEDKEVFISKCDACSQQNYFYWNYDTSDFSCYACTKPYANEKIRCPECGQPPRRVRTRPKAKY